MYLGMSKSLGGGFRVGFGTRISSKNKGPSSSELRTAEFKQFLEKVQLELDYAMATYIEANGYNFDNVKNEQTDLNELFSNSADYDDFIAIFTNAKKEIEKILFSGDNGVVAKRVITDEVFKIKGFLETNYPGFEPSKPPRKVSALLGIGIFLFPLLCSWITLKEGYSKRTRIISFSWLVGVYALAYFVPI